MSQASSGVLGSLLFEMKFWARYILPTAYVAVFYPSPPSVVERMLKLTQCSAADTLYDLGSGDGRVVIAAGRLGARAVGYELDRDLCAQAKQAIAQERLEHRCTVVNADAGTADVRDATIIALYLSDRGNRELMARVAGTLQPRTKVVSNFFAIEGWEGRHVTTCLADPLTGPIHLYQVPAGPAGTGGEQHGARRGAPPQGAAAPGSEAAG